MVRTLLVQVADALERIIEQHAQEHPGTQVGSLDDPQAAIEQVEADPTEIAVLVVGADVPDPLRLTQRVHAADRSLPVLLLAESSARKVDLEKALRFTPFLGEDVRCLDSGDPQGVAEQVAEAAERRQRRLTFATNAAIMNERLSDAIAPPKIAGHFSRLLDQAPIGVVTVDRHGQIYGWNRFAQQLLDASERQELGRPLSLMFASPEREQVHQYVMDALHPSEPMRTVTFERSQVKGEPQFLELSAMAVEVAPDRPGAIVLLQDVTTREQAQRLREQAEEALRQQHRWYEATVMSIGDAVIATDEQGRITLMNVIAEQLTGWTLEEATGIDSRKVFHIINEASREEVDSPVTRVLREGAIVGLANHTLLVSKDGREIPIDDSGAPIRDSAGEIVGTVLVFRDISERRESERALHASEQRLRLILENLTDYAIFTTNLKGRITSWNAGAQNLLGYEEQEILSLPASVVFVPEDRDAEIPEKEIQRALEHGRASDDRWHMRKDGSYFWATGLMTALRNDDGQIQGFVKILRDQTESKRAAEQLEARARQQAAVAELGQRALAGPDLPELLDDAVKVVAQTLEIDFSKVLRLLPEGDTLLLEAGVGGPAEWIGKATVDATPGSHAGYSLASDTPVVVKDLKQETRFHGMPILHEHGVTSGMTAIISGRTGRPWGVLTAHTRERRDFTPDDVNFLRAVANILATGIQRKSNEQELQTLNETLEQRVADRTADAERRTAQLQAMAAELTHAEQRERRRLAEVLHDHLQQLLAASKMKISTILRRTEAPEVKQPLQEVEDLLEESITASRDLTAELSPRILYQGTLPEALEWLARWVEEKHGLKVELEVVEPVDSDDDQLRVLVFQSVRELLFNAVKYSGVEKAQVILSREGKTCFRVQVADQGQGFDPDVVFGQLRDRGGFGLFSIRERLELLGGWMTIESAPGHGTTVSLVVPLQRSR